MTTFVRTFTSPDGSRRCRPFPTFDGAKRDLIRAVKLYEDCAACEADAEEFCALAEDINHWTTPLHTELLGMEFAILEDKT